MFIDESHAKLHPAMAALLAKYKADTDDLTVYVHTNFLKYHRNRSCFGLFSRKQGGGAAITFYQTRNDETNKFILLHELGHYHDWKATRFRVSAQLSVSSMQFQHEVAANVWAIREGGIPVVNYYGFVVGALNQLNIIGPERARLLKSYKEAL